MPKRSKAKDPPVSKSPRPSQEPSPPRKRSKQVKTKEEDDDIVDVDPEPGLNPEGDTESEPESQGDSEDSPEDGSEVDSEEESDPPSDPEAAFSDLGSFDDNASNTPSCNDVVRDPDYYFKDGNVIVRVGDVLFKIHSSSFEMRSTVFKDMFNMEVDEDEESSGGSQPDESTGDNVLAEGKANGGDGEKEKDEEAEGEVVDGEETEGESGEVDEGSESDKEVEPDAALEGTMDSIPIFISGAEPSEFRNLLKVFYSLPYEAPIIGLDKEASGQGLWDNFELLLDVAKLSSRFCIPDMEKWATAQLETLVRTKTVELANIFRDSDVTCDYVVGALRHAKTVSAARLTYNVRYILMTSCRSPPNIVTNRALPLIRLEDLLEVDKALYGYAFVLLLWLGNKHWVQASYSHVDRMAFFSAQSYLSPLPATLFDGLKTHLYAAPDSAPSFSKKMSTPVTAQSCIDKCHERIFRAWKEEFDPNYYKGLTSFEFMSAMRALQSLVERRMKFGSKIGALLCPHSCHNSILSQLDQDIEKLFAGLADYYKAIP